MPGAVKNRMRISSSSLVLVACLVAGSRTSSAAVCDSIHAAKIAYDAGLSDCTTPIPWTHRQPSSGSLLPTSACHGLTANACATYFRVHPDEGLIRNPPTSGAYMAHHVGMALDLRLPDGTRPMVYYKPAPGTIASNPHFNSWLFFFYGGAGMCAQDVVQAEGRAGVSSLASQGASCFDKLDYGSQEEAHAGTGFSRDLFADFSHAGILGDHPDNAVFANYNRVIITKSNDYYIGDVTKPNVDVGHGFTVKTMPLQGNAIVKATFAFFTTPVQGGADFNDARRVLFVSSSSGTNSVHRVDEWRMDVLARAPNAYVGLMANSSGVTPDSFTLEEFDDAPCGSVYIGNCGATFDNPPHGMTPSTGLLTTDATPRRLAFSHATFLDYVPTTWDGVSDGQIAPGMEAHNLASVSAFTDSVLDASCVGTEAPADRWKCRSPLYVMFNHLRTPLFIAHSLRDKSNIKGVIKGIASRDARGFLPTWLTVAWPAGHPFEGQSPMESLARFQFSSWVNDRNDAGGAVGDSRYAGPIGVWAPNCDHHEPEKSDVSFVGTADEQVLIGSPADNANGRITLQSTLVQWFEGRASIVRIDGYDDSKTVYEHLRPDGCR